MGLSMTINGDKMIITSMVPATASPTRRSKTSPMIKNDKGSSIKSSSSMCTGFRTLVNIDMRGLLVADESTVERIFEGPVMRRFIGERILEASERRFVGEKFKGQEDRLGCVVSEMIMAGSVISLAV